MAVLRIMSFFRKAVHGSIPGEHTVIDENAFGEIPNLTIVAEEGSDAAAFAETHGYMLKLMDGTN